MSIFPPALSVKPVVRYAMKTRLFQRFLAEK
jgi:hypothetical protein